MADPLADPAVNRRGILATLIAVVLWTCNDTCGKLASEVFPTGEMMAIRGVFAVSIAVSLVVVTGHGRMLWRGARLVLRPMVLLRALLDAAVVFSFLKALAHMQLADVTAISQATPIIMTLMAAAFGLERIGWRRFLADPGRLCGRDARREAFHRRLDRLRDARRRVRRARRRA